VRRRDRMSARLLLAAAILFFSPTAHAQPQTPPRDRPVAPQRTGTSVIRGRVVDGQTGNAVPRARVRLSGGRGLHAPALTDETGAFAFKALPRGTYSLSVEKPTYVRARYPDAGQTLRALAQQITLADGQVVDGLT